VAELASQTGIGPPDLIELPTVRRFKIDVRFPCWEKGLEVVQGA